MPPTFWQRLRHGLRAHKLLLLALLAGLVLPWVVFLNVAEDIWESGGFVGDHQILTFLHQHTTPLLDALALALTAIGAPWPMGALAGLIGVGLAWKGRWSAAWFLALSVGGAMALNILVKTAFARPRPALWVSLKPTSFYSFPSGHAMATAALALALGFLLWQHRRRWLAWMLSALFVVGVGWSRVYLGVHYPSDVLAGWAGSVGWVAGLHVLFSPAFHRLRGQWRTAWHRWLPSVVSAPDETKSAVPPA